MEIADLSAPRLQTSLAPQEEHEGIFSNLLLLVVFRPPTDTGQSRNVVTWSIIPGFLIYRVELSENSPL